MKHRSLRVLLVVFLGLFVHACSDEDDSGTLAPPAFDLTDSWSISETVDATGCGEGTLVDDWTLTATQSGNSLTAVTPVGTFTGTVSGSRVRWSGDYPEDGGTTTITVTATIDSSGDALSGTSTWSWTDGTNSCSGTSVFTGTRNP